MAEPPVYEPAKEGLEGLKPHYDLLIIGAGLAGGVIAERAATLLGKTSLIIDKRDHIGGNVYDSIDEHGFRISKCVRGCGHLWCCTTCMGIPMRGPTCTSTI